MDNRFSTANLVPNWTVASEILKGDLPGHPFHGNQYRTGSEQTAEMTKLAYNLRYSAVFASVKTLSNVASSRKLYVSTGTHGFTPVQKPAPNAGENGEHKGWRVQDIPYLSGQQRPNDPGLMEKTKGLEDNLRRSAEIYSSNKVLASKFRDAADSVRDVSRTYERAQQALDGFKGFANTQARTLDHVSDYDYQAGANYATVADPEEVQRTFSGIYDRLNDAISKADVAVAKAALAQHEADPNTVVKSLIQKGDLPGHIFHGNQYQQATATAEVARGLEAKAIGSLDKMKAMQEPINEAYEAAYDSADFRDENGEIYIRSDRDLTPEIQAYEELSDQYDAKVNAARSDLKDASNAYALLSYHALKTGDTDTADAYSQKAGELSERAKGLQYNSPSVHYSDDY
jgi:hypothetical protein